MKAHLFCLAAMFASVCSAAPDALPGSRVLWLENDRVRQAWVGEDLLHVIDEETGAPCLEWFQAPATNGTATLTLRDTDPANYDAIRLQWKYIGGGAGLTVNAGRRNWYLFKDKYRPDVWHDTWLDLSLDDDMGGAILRSNGTFEIQLQFSNFPQNRAGEQTWRRIRVRNLGLVKFPVRLACDPGRVTYEQDHDGLRTVFPMRLTNTTESAQTVELLLDPAPLRDFGAAFATNEITLAPNAAATVPLTFSIPAVKAAAHAPLYIEEAPVYARVKGDPDSLTTWYRAYVQWKPGGVIPPRRTATPIMTDPETRTNVLLMAGLYPWARQALDGMLAVKDILERPVVVPELRHGYPSHNICPEHQKPVKQDLVAFRRHWCEAGKHFVEGADHLDRAAAMVVHTRNSDDCAKLGWAWFLGGDERCARKAAELLLAYARRYPEWSYAGAGATGYRIRVAHAVLGECWWIHGFVQGYDLIADSPALTEAQKQTIRERLFLTAAEDIQTHRICHNQQCEINAAAGCAAINAGAWYLAALRFSGTYGLLDMIELGFSDEGFSRENEFPYHFAALLPIVAQGLSWEAHGGHFFDTRVKRLFDAPLAFSLDQELGRSELYEIAYRYYRDPAYVPQLHRERPSREALLYGVPEVPQPSGSNTLRNSSLPLAGKSTLRRGTAGDLRALQIHWGAPTYRGGKDMLNYLVSFRGTALNRSVTRIGYGYSVHGLSYDTLAGNLVQVDGLDQTGVRPVQVLIEDGDLPMARYEATRAAAMYPGVSHSRTYAIAGDAFVVIDRLAADRERRFDLAYYPSADAVTSTPELVFADYPQLAGQGSGYDALESPAIATCPPSFTLDYQPNKTLKARTHILLDGPGQLLRARTYTGWNPYLTPIYLARRQGKTFTAVTVIEAGETNLPIAAIERLPVLVEGRAVPSSERIAIRIRMKNGRTYDIDDGSEARE
ncbi:MAG: hypothetical protein PHR35_11020 [Kiritimatiellae bacterium]|nr:hypothetical protein [Kiritimatiellia bacterium]